MFRKLGLTLVMLVAAALAFPVAPSLARAQELNSRQCNNVYLARNTLYRSMKTSDIKRTDKGFSDVLAKCDAKFRHTLGKPRKDFEVVLPDGRSLDELLSR